MGRWTDIATWAGPSPNQGSGMVEQRGVVLHIAEGTYEGTVAWCLNGSSDISAHFVSAKNGRAAQVVDTDITAWTQSAGNGRWISIEFEGYAGSSLSSEQMEFAAQVLAHAHSVYGVPLQLADSPSSRGLGYHGMGGAAWGGHTGCPGAPIVAQRPAIVARAARIIEGDEVLTPEDLKAITQNVATAVLRGTWRDGYTSGTFDPGYRGSPTQPMPTVADAAAAIATVRSEVAGLRTQVTALSTPAVSDAQVAAIGARLENQLGALVEATIRKVLGGLDEPAGS